MNISQNFKELRIKKGVSIYQLSKQSDISETYIRRIEQGINQPSIQVLQALLPELQTTISEFFYEENISNDYSPLEKSLIKEFRMLSEEKSEAIHAMVKLLNN